MIIHTAEAVARFVKESPGYIRLDTDDTGDGWMVVSDEDRATLVARLKAAGITVDESDTSTPDYSVGLWEFSWAWIANK